MSGSQRGLFRGIVAVSFGMCFLVPVACAPIRRAPEVTIRTVAIAAAVDGDTLVAQDDTILRLIGIDAPELGHHGSSDDCGAGSARQRLSQLVSGRSVEVADYGYDRYGRTLATVEVSGSDAALDLLREGWASAWVPAGGVYPPNWRAYLEAARAAQAQSVGAWGVCPEVGRATERDARITVQQADQEAEP